MPHTVVIRYSPDFIQGEFVNVGVLVYDVPSRQIGYVFLEDVDRMATFFGMTQRQAYKLVSGLADEAPHWTIEMILKACSEWTGSVQFSAPMGTTLSVPEALVDAAARYLNLKIK